jgi:hypothetical protein
VERRDVMPRKGVVLSGALMTALAMAGDSGAEQALLEAGGHKAGRALAETGAERWNEKR